jgi:hypothetical protein
MRSHSKIMIDIENLNRKNIEFNRNINERMIDILQPLKQFGICLSSDRCETKEG